MSPASVPPMPVPPRPWSFPTELRDEVPVLINACLTGTVATRESDPHVPLTPEAIVEDAVRVFDAGARLVHLHARDRDGRPTWKAEVYERILTGIRRERPALICCVSTTGRLWSEPERRAEVLSLEGAARPDLASLTPGSIDMATGPNLNPLPVIRDLARTMKARGIHPEVEILHPGMMNAARTLAREGLLPLPGYFNLVFGRRGALTPATVGHLTPLVAALPADASWCVGGLGRAQLPMNLAGLLCGGGVRVGIEDARWFDAARTRPARNVDLVERIVRYATELGRRVATPAEARAMLGLEPRP